MKSLIIKNTIMFILFIFCGYFLLSILNFHIAYAKNQELTYTAKTSRVYRLSGHEFELHNEERVPPGENEAILATSDIITQFLKMRSTDQGQSTRRGVHPKSHGCVHASFKINDKISELDQVGIFKPGQTYNALIRFSNADPTGLNSDSETDSRGMGIKVYNIQGKHVIHPSETTQEFTLNSTDTFFADGAESYRQFMQIALLESNSTAAAVTKYILNLANHFQFSLSARVAKSFAKLKSTKPTNPLSIQYFSIAAFQHGKGPTAPIVKYSTIPCGGTWSENVDITNKNFLKDQLVRSLNQKSACFKFLIQHKKNKYLEVEDLTMPWSSELAPMNEIATLTIPAQNLLDENHCESSVINPWNSLTAHKPVGGINRLRLATYLKSIELRKKTTRK